MKDCPLCKQPLPEGEKNPAQRFIGAYCDAYLVRYKTYPEILGSDAGIAKRLVKDMGADRAISYIQTYLAMSDSYFITRRHDLKTFEANVSKVKVTHDTGDNITQREAAQADRRQSIKNAFSGLLGEDERK